MTTNTPSEAVALRVDVASAAAPASDRRASRGGFGYLLAAVGFSAVVYYPVTRNYFYLDDFLNLYRIVNDPPLHYLLTPHGGHLLLTRNALFFLTFQLIGPTPQYYYWTVLLVHIANVCLLYRLVRLTTGSAPLASFGASLWGTSAFNESTLGWYSVLGQVIAVTALLLILCQAQRLAVEGRTPDRRKQWGWYALALAAATSFGTGTVAALLLPFVLLMLLPHWRSWRRPPLVSLLVSVPALYLVTNRLYTRLTGVESLPSVPWMTLFSHLVPLELASLRLASISLASLLLGFWFRFWAAVPWSWYAITASFAAAVILAARKSLASVRGQLAACTLLVLGCCSVIVVARAFMIDLAQLATPTYGRWHYMNQILLTVMLCIVLARARLIVPSRIRRGLVVAWYAASLAFYARLAPPIDHHAEARHDTEEVLAGMHAAIRASPPGEPVFIPNTGFRPMAFLIAPEFFPGRAAVFVIFHRDNRTDDGGRIYFVEEDRRVIEATKRGRRTADLLVTADRAL